MTYRKGDTIKYTKDIMFKGEEEIEAKIVAIINIVGRKKLLLETGDEINIID